MEAKGLMINDWVECPSRNGVESLHTQRLDVDMLYDLVRSNYDIAINPIKLTGEILEKNGFDHIDYNECGYNDRFIYGSDSAIICITGNYLFIGVAQIIDKNTMHLNVNYVHELQHALRVCGLNDLADNFKI